MWYVCDVLYAGLYVCVCCVVVRGCAVSRRYIYMFAIVICLVLVMCTMTICSVLCVLMVEGLSVVVNVMFSLMSKFHFRVISYLSISKFNRKNYCSINF